MLEDVAGRALFACVLLTGLAIALTPWMVREVRHQEARATIGMWASNVGLGGCAFITILAVSLRLAGSARICALPGPIHPWWCRLCLIALLVMLASLLSFVVSLAAWPPWRRPFKPQLVRLLHLVSWCLTPLSLVVSCGD